MGRNRMQRTETTNYNGTFSERIMKKWENGNEKMGNGNGEKWKNAKMRSLGDHLYTPS